MVRVVFCGVVSAIALALVACGRVDYALLDPTDAQADADSAIDGGRQDGATDAGDAMDVAVDVELDGAMDADLDGAMDADLDGAMDADLDSAMDARDDVSAMEAGEDAMDAAPPLETRCDYADDDGDGRVDEGLLELGPEYLVEGATSASVVDIRALYVTSLDVLGVAYYNGADELYFTAIDVSRREERGDTPVGTGELTNDEAYDIAWDGVSFRLAYSDKDLKEVSTRPVSIDAALGARTLVRDLATGPSLVRYEFAADGTSYVGWQLGSNVEVATFDAAGSEDILAVVTTPLVAPGSLDLLTHLGVTHYLSVGTSGSIRRQPLHGGGSTEVFLGVGAAGPIEALPSRTANRVALAYAPGTLVDLSTDGSVEATSITAPVSSTRIVVAAGTEPAYAILRFAGAGSFGRVMPDGTPYDETIPIPPNTMELVPILSGSDRYLLLYPASAAGRAAYRFVQCASDAGPP